MQEASHHLIFSNGRKKSIDMFGARLSWPAAIKVYLYI